MSLRGGGLSQRSQAPGRGDVFTANAIAVYVCLLQVDVTSRKQFQKILLHHGILFKETAPCPGPINAPVKSELLTTSLSLMLPEALGRGSGSSPCEAWGFGLWLPHRRLLSLPPQASGLVPGAAQESAGAALRRSSVPSLAPGCISSCRSALGTDSPVRLCT